jgi:phage tail-like protein
MATTKYPIPTFHFTVSYGGNNADFTEVSGLTRSVKNLDYRGGASKNFLPIRLPGLPEVQNITLKKGIFAQDSELYKWLSEGVENRNPNNVDRRDITISLMSADHLPVVVWTIRQAWPIKVDGPSLNSTGNEIAMETVELCHEGIELETV